MNADGIAGTAEREVSGWNSAPPPPLDTCTVHVWRIRLGGNDSPSLWNDLSVDEQERARRFHFDVHRRSFVHAHAMLRRILATYTDVAAPNQEFVTGEFGKPSLRGAVGQDDVQFNLSHSGELALVAVSRGKSVGVDVERWNADIEHLSLAEHFFSRTECRALRALADARQEVVAGFFAAWSRKEAYLKASGFGITRGLHHFDVTLWPGEPTRLVEDRLDRSAPERWIMRSIAVGDGYSAALVAEAPVDQVLLFDGQ